MDLLPDLNCIDPKLLAYLCEYNINFATLILALIVSIEVWQLFFRISKIYQLI